MRKICFLLLFSLVFLLVFCSTEPAPLNNPRPQVSILHLLLFQKEKKGEVWAMDSLGLQKIETFALSKSTYYPIGIFDLLSENEMVLIDFTNNKALRNTIVSKDQTIDKNLPELLSLLTAEEAIALGKQLEVVEQKQIFIFPNDIRNGGTFITKMNRPIWQTELYSSMEVWIGKFPLLK